jgi:hypothetical protein
MRRMLLYMSVTLLLSWLAPVSTQAQQQNHTLVLNGQPSQVPVIQVNGHAYADLDAFAKATNSTLVVKGNEVELSLPGAGGNASSATSASGSAENTGLSRAFLKAGIEAMSTLREWHSALANAIQNQYPIAENWVVQYRNQAETGIRLASTAASTDDDRSAMQLLENEFNNMKQLSDEYLAKVQSHAYIAPESLQSNPLEQKIVTCGHSLANMAASGQFQDNGSCR